MEHSTETRIDALLSEQAAAWFVRLVANDLSLRERRQYLAWLKASSRHVEALLDIYRYHGYGRKAKLNNRMTAASADATDAGWDANVIPFAPRSGVRGIPEREPVQRRRRYARAAAVVAGIAFTIVVGLIIQTNYLDERIATGAGEWDKMLLADGSVLRVGPNTEVRWSFDDSGRSVVLTRGEAVFEVAKDPQRPFIVTTDLGDVRAVGTEFGVSLLNVSTVVVTVAHGKVAVSKPGSGRFLVNHANGAIADLIANQQLVMSADRVEPVEQVDAEHELQWATGYYEFRGETVSDAVSEFNRRNRQQVVIDHPSIGAIAMPLTTVRLNDPNSFVAMLDARSDVRVFYDTGDVIRLKPE